ncbi:ORF6-like protein [Guinea pig adenovirus 1]|uniref:ORF6-like protein n=1 Tax=Guinea pig adenovirus 1 TaxID=2847100 RepID=A0AC61M092_9ADEN|nr:ORF6-like protein [Guinea pig adenovirus]QIZ64173.1 ORF6-like protein [Guinea pig adenovirus 1]QIZ64205.1 ORF6-like protein [Guinea pig adenovirus]
MDVFGETHSVFGLAPPGANREHIVAEIRGVPTAASFALHGCLLVPWPALLTDYERRVFETFVYTCPMPGLVECRRSHLVHGFERWTVHCHCDSANANASLRSPCTLRCQSQARLVCSFFRVMLLGTAYDRVYAFYRFRANAQSCAAVYYIGSVWLRDQHLVYLYFPETRDIRRCTRGMSFGFSYTTRACVSNFVVLQCLSCARCDEMSARVCCRRTRLLIKKARALLRRGPHARTRDGRLKKRFKRCVYLSARLKMLHRLARYGQCFAMDDYVCPPARSRDYLL